MTRRTIGVGFDGSPGSRRALLEAIRLALLEEAFLEVITVEELPRYPGTVGEVIEEQQLADNHSKGLHEEVLLLANEHGLKIKTGTILGHPAKALVDFAADAKLDLLVLGHFGHSALWGSFLGTIADRVVRHAPCSVLVVR